MPWRAALAVAVYLIAAMAFEHYYWQLDVTTSKRNSLLPATVSLLEQMTDELQLVAYVADEERAREVLHQLHERYQRHKSNISLSLVDPTGQPEQARQLGVRPGGELFIKYGGAERRLQTVNEQSIGNALQQLLRGDQQWLVFVTGHGERDPLGSANHEFGRLGQILKDNGYKIFQQNLALASAVPDNTSVLVIASARSAYLPGEGALILDYVNRGGNLLWLTEPNQHAGLRQLAAEFGVRLLPGVVLDPAARQLQVAQIDFTLATDFSNTHPVTRGARNVCLLPRSAGLQTQGGPWRHHTLLRSSARTWSEVGELHDAKPQPEQGDTPGPLDLVVALTRPREDGSVQRVVVAGDGDFLSNTYLDNGGNRELGVNLINWLSNDDSFIDLSRRPEAEIKLHLSAPVLIGFALIFLLLLPVTLAGAGVIIRWRRHRR